MWLLQFFGVCVCREIHPLDPQPHRYCMLASTASAPRVTRCSLGLYWSGDLCSKHAGWLGDVILSRSDSERQRNLMMHAKNPFPVYYSQVCVCGGGGGGILSSFLRGEGQFHIKVVLDTLGDDCARGCSFSYWSNCTCTHRGLYRWAPLACSHSRFSNIALFHSTSLRLASDPSMIQAPVHVHVHVLYQSAAKRSRLPRLLHN